MDLGNWMNKILIGWGIDPKIANTFDEAIIAILMICIAVGLDYLCQAILVGGMRKYTKHRPASAAPEPGVQPGAEPVQRPHPL